MSVYGEQRLIAKEGSENEVRKFEANLEWRMNYFGKKVYDKLSQNTVSEILKTKIVLGESYYKILRTEKVAFEAYVCLSFLGAKKRYVNFYELVAFGFKKTSLQRAVKFLTDIGLILKVGNAVKIKKFKLTNDDRKFIVISGDKDWKIFLLFGLANLWAYKTLVWKSKELGTKKFVKSAKRKVIVQNNFLGLKGSTAYRYLKNICLVLGLRTDELFIVQRSVDNSQHLSFKTQRYLVMHI